MGSDSGRESQSRVLEGLRPASLIREAVVGQTPLFIELSLLTGVCAFFLWVGESGRWRGAGDGGEHKGAAGLRMPMSSKKGTQTGQPGRTRVSGLIEKELMLERFFAVCEVGSHS